MKAAQFNSYGSLDVLEIAELDTPIPQKNQILVKVHAAALNPKDVLVRKGKFQRFTGSKFPQGVGLDFSGVVEDPNGQDYEKGQKVFGMLNGWHGRCAAEYLAIPADEVHSMPENLSFVEAASIPLVGQTSLQAIRDLGKIPPGKKVLINGGSGGVGTIAIQIAKTLDAHVTTLSSERNIDLCRSLGADEALDYNEDDVFTGNTKYDLFYDVFGNKDFPTCQPILTERGIYVTTVPKATIFREQFKNCFRKQKGRLVFVKSKKKDLLWLHDRILEGKIKPVIDKVFHLEEVRAAEAYIETKRARGKVVLEVVGG